MLAGRGVQFDRRQHPKNVGMDGPAAALKTEHSRETPMLKLAGNASSCRCKRGRLDKKRPVPKDWRGPEDGEYTSVISAGSAVELAPGAAASQHVRVWRSGCALDCASWPTISTATSTTRLAESSVAVQRRPLGFFTHHPCSSASCTRVSSRACRSIGRGQYIERSLPRAVGENATTQGSRVGGS